MAHRYEEEGSELIVKYHFGLGSAMHFLASCVAAMQLRDAFSLSQYIPPTE